MEVMGIGKAMVVKATQEQAWDLRVHTAMAEVQQMGGK